MTVIKPTLPVKPATSPAHAQAVKVAQVKIDQALRGKPTGPKGFLTWVIAAWPKPIADKILAAARAHQAMVGAASVNGAIAQAGRAAKVGMRSIGRYEGPTTFGAIAPVPTRGSSLLTWSGRQRRAGMGSFASRATRSGLGDSSAVASMGSGALTDAITIAPADASTVDNSSTAAASPSWLSSIGSAITAATQGYLGIQQAKDAQTLFDTNLQRASQGLPPLNANPSAYGIINPQVNVGLSSNTQTLLIAGGIGLGVILLLNVGVKAAKRG